jgi:hypothetical protein
MATRKIVTSGCVIVNKSGRNVDGRIWKNCSKAQNHIKGVIKNNSISQRKQTGFVGLKTKRVKLNERESNEMKRTKDFIRD